MGGVFQLACKLLEGRSQVCFLSIVFPVPGMAPSASHVCHPDPRAARRSRRELRAVVGCERAKQGAGLVGLSFKPTTSLLFF